ncbi:MAG: FolC bifunctional protein [Firmicutes bacterium]|nr:FolC bifunctional protein [Bacillota bacterium]MDI6706714.1 folylpolyglutamate synthase/dihydrofolate synthase family protein [Bacillota bacterium]
MNFSEAMDYIHGTYKFGSRLGLETMNRLLELMDQPQNRYKCIHVAGTNGKGSTSAFIASILGEAGFKTGLYTSPYLERFTERIRVDGAEISHGDLASITDYVKRRIDIMIDEGFPHPTEFELVTAIGFEYFNRMKADYAVVEVGLGGRLDATNTISPQLSVITSIGMDHMEILGDSLASISKEKAGIIKKGIPVVVHPQDAEALQVIKETCERLDAPLIDTSLAEIANHRSGIKGQHFDLRWDGKLYKDIFIGMLGPHQVMNAVSAVAAAVRLGIDENAIRKGMEAARWPGRFEILRRKPFVIIDGAHNLQGAKVLMESLEQLFPGKRMTLVFGILRDKDVERISEMLASKASRVLTTLPVNPRSMAPEELEKIVRKYNQNVESTRSIGEAVTKSLEEAGEDDVIVFSGSLYMIGEVRKILPPQVF